VGLISTAAFLASSVAGVEGAFATSECTVSGTNGRDRLIGTQKADTICGHGGRDVIRAAGGDDKLLGGGGRDFLSGERGDDVLDGQGGRDRLRGGNGNDTCLTPGSDLTLDDCFKPDPLFPPGYPPSATPAPGHCWGHPTPSGDSCVPGIHGFAMEPLEVDTSSAPAKLRWTLYLSDDTGVERSGVMVCVPTPGQSSSSCTDKDTVLASGSAQAGVWSGVIELPEGYMQGTHSLSVMVTDLVGNYFNLQPAHLRYYGYPSAFRQIGQEDRQDPFLSHYDAMVGWSDNWWGRRRIITFRADAGDDFTGVEHLAVILGGPDGEEYWSEAGVLEEGSALNGRWRIHAPLPADAPAGTYEVKRVQLRDSFRFRTYETSELQAMGLQTHFVLGPN
jgi:hypothetical protein